jgi:hypothetical protein
MAWQNSLLPATQPSKNATRMIVGTYLLSQAANPHFGPLSIHPIDQASNPLTRFHHDTTGPNEITIDGAPVQR